MDGELVFFDYYSKSFETNSDPLFIGKDIPGNEEYFNGALDELKIYDDGRSDDKGVEPESIAIGRVGSKTIAIVGMERADAFAIYDITTPTAPVFIKMYKTGDAPEGIIFIPASKSPINQSLIVISSENDGLVKIYKSTKL
jgi:hypothetical protein